MKEISHKGLARMVGTIETPPLELETLEIIVNAAVEPDRIDQIRFSEDFFYGIKWLYNHTIGAKDLAIKFFNKSYDAYIRNDNSWAKELGIAFHFITDWGTPHHSLTSKSNPILDFIKTGSKLGGTIGAISKTGSSTLDELIGFLKGTLIGGGISGGIGLIFLHLAHRNFENRCDERWKENLQLIREIYEAKAQHQKIPLQLEKALVLFEEKMNKLSQIRDNLPANWIDKCSDVEFAEYMVNIALVMDFVFKVVIMKR